jgi:hypothetical protein
MMVMRNAYTILVGNPERKGSFEKYGRRQYNNIKTGLQKIGMKLRTG